MLKFSLIVPVYNTEKYLPRCLESLLNQTYKCLEILLIDDGSTDSSRKICDEYRLKDHRVKVWHKENGGVSSARNLGIKVATGDFITFIDSDDWIDLDYLEVIKNQINGNDIECIINSLVRINKTNYKLDDDNNTMFLGRQEALIQMAEGKKFSWEVVATFYRRDVINKVRFDENICFGEDLLFKYNFIIKCQHILYSPLQKYYYDFRESSACNSYSVEKLIDDLKVFEYIMNNESSTKVSEILFGREYLPRLIGRYRLALFAEEKNLIVINLLKRKILCNLRRAFLSNQVSISVKVKMMVAICPSWFVRVAYNLYK